MKHFSWALPVLLLGWANGLKAAEPMMDTGLLGSYRSAPPNLAQDGNFSEAIDRERKALRIAQDQFGDLHPSLAPIFDDLAALERTAGLYSRAEEDYRWALALREKAFGLGSKPVGLSLLDLAALLSDLGRFDEATLCVQKAYKILSQNGDSDEAQCLLEWGILARENKDLPGSEDRLRECLGMRSQVPPRWQVEEELARTLLAAGKKDEALKMAEGSLADRKTLYRADSPEVGRSLQFSGDIHRAAGTGQATDLYEAAAAIRDRLIGPDLFTNIPYLQESAETDQALGRFKIAQALFWRVLALTRQYYGPEHPRTAFLLEKLAYVDRSLKEEGKAREQQQEAVRILEKALGHDHPATLRALQLLEKLKGK
ncbi:MAG TPA: tetratricopeptide repeat protein [bacterium]|nr:tetratricopeptide repeat protein [bacterium]